MKALPHPSSSVTLHKCIGDLPRRQKPGSQRSALHLVSIGTIRALICFTERRSHFQIFSSTSDHSDGFGPSLASIPSSVARPKCLGDRHGDRKHTQRSVHYFVRFEEVRGSRRVSKPFRSLFEKPEGTGRDQTPVRTVARVSSRSPFVVGDLDHPWVAYLLG